MSSSQEHQELVVHFDHLEICQKTPTQQPSIIPQQKQQPPVPEPHDDSVVESAGADATTNFYEFEVLIPSAEIPPPLPACCCSGCQQEIRRHLHDHDYVLNQDINHS